MRLLLLPLLLFFIPANAFAQIAYVRGGTEIRIIDPDGTNDRRLWTHPDARPELGISGVAWRPDHKELVFSSGHAAVASLFHSDLYAIAPDGSGFRKLTNPPDRSEYKKFPKGNVTVTVRNDQPTYQQSQASAGIFIVYVMGADEPQQVTRLENEFARNFSVSPDGKWIVFERAKTVDKDQEADLWIVGVDGSNMRLLVRNGFEPSWAR